MTRLTVAQALVRFLSVQHTERDGVRQRLIAGTAGIFGHGNVAGVGQALLQNTQQPGPGEQPMPYTLFRNEQSMVHAAVGFARARRRLQTLACTASIGPGSTNMVTGAALATINRIPVLLLPSDTFATRVADPVLQQLEDPRSAELSVNDAFRPVSRYWDRVHRPEQLGPALLQAMRVLTDPAETGAVTLCLPQDVQAQAHDFPDELFLERTWHVRRPEPDVAELARAAEVIRGARRPLLVAGGGVLHAEAEEALAAFADATGIPVADTQAGKGALPAAHPASVGGVGATGNPAANALAAEADVVIGVGTRWSDFTTASRTVFAADGVRFVNLNVTAFDAAKHAGTTLVADGRQGLRALTDALGPTPVGPDRAARVADLRTRWSADRARLLAAPAGRGLSQLAVFGLLNDMLDADDVLVNAAGSMPGDLQAIWEADGPGQYHLEYGYSCMGYEIPAAIGVRTGHPQGRVVALVGDGTYLMQPSELATIRQQGLDVVVVVLQNHGFGSIGGLSESVGSQRFGTSYREADADPEAYTGVDLAANAASFGLPVASPATLPELREALTTAFSRGSAGVVVVEVDPNGPVPPSTAWWDVPVAETSALASTQAAREEYQRLRTAQRPYL